MLTEINRSKVQNELADSQHRNMRGRRQSEIKNNAKCDVNEESSADATAGTPPKNKVLHALAMIRRGLQIEGADMCTFFFF